MSLIDTHAHLTFEGLVENLDDVLGRSRDAGVDTWVTVGTSPQENIKNIELARRYDNMYAAAGFHPHDARLITEDDLQALSKQINDDKVVALGEIGLDYHYNYSEPQIQQDIFRKQLEIAAAAGMPVILHSREAFEDTFAILTEYMPRLKDVVFHCFGGGAAEAQRAVEMGCYISFTGTVTFKNADTAREAATAVPLERLMVETDCPFMSPAPMRKQRTNEPALMIHTATKLAELHNTELEEIARVTTRNAVRFFGLKQ
ncbi:putative deoxyribonuclease YcfH [Limihaloglobus sulfuriphilus]|uniref:Putative deoxyribonuclease YcfH n=1 Tax=Limihaloglobus sulfuriphilus TaxID=1851148 RepID=A0A1Q2MDM9_9BACT|nr:TatD family hydrolase [Limihaloglobus sulfuriphilus]AQQ70801.1 putative deoxyribonuclease YcfH [Limihaloglobus sulfuriphilus]